jgi:hypothetical protein
MRAFQAGFLIAACAFQTGAVCAAQIYNCDNSAEDVLRISQEQRNAFDLLVIGLVERQKLHEEDQRIVCQGLALFSDGSRQEMRYTAYVEFDQWWVQYEQWSEAGYPDVLLLDHELAERRLEIEKLPQRIAELLEELEAFPAEHFGPGSPPLTIQLQVSEFGFLEGLRRVSETGRAIPLSLMDDRESAALGVFTTTFTDPIWQQAAPVALTWTFTATPSPTPGSPPIITWPGSGIEVAEAAPLAAGTEPASAPSTPAPASNPATSVEVTTEIAEVTAAPPPARPGKTKTKPPQLACTYSIDRISNDGRQLIGKGQLAVRNAALVPLTVAWLTDGKDAEDASAGFSLSIGSDGSIRGSIPVYFLFPEPGRPRNEPVIAQIELPSVNGAIPHNGEAEFPLDHVFTGAFTLAGCVDLPR